MNLTNAKRKLLFAEDANGNVLTQEQLQAKYGFEPDGTNFYYGINQANVEAASGGATALNATHQAFFNAILSSLKASSQDEKTVILGLEPPDQVHPYAFVSQNLALVDRLASDLYALQKQALGFGKRLNIIIRYASEMNDGGQTQGHDPVGFRSTFVQVRQSFKNNAPGILFSFSPALRADLPESLIAQYWPGDEVVDVIGGTWYIGAGSQTAASTANMQAYFLHRIGTNKPFALSEVGGSDSSGGNNDGVLEGMCHTVEAIDLQGVTFGYLTIFLASKYGSDATLGFLST